MIVTPRVMELDQPIVASNFYLFKTANGDFIDIDKVLVLFIDPLKNMIEDFYDDQDEIAKPGKSPSIVFPLSSLIVDARYIRILTDWYLTRLYLIDAGRIDADVWPGDFGEIIQAMPDAFLDDETSLTPRRGTLARPDLLFYQNLLDDANVLNLLMVARIANFMDTARVLSSAMLRVYSVLQSMSMKRIHNVLAEPLRQMKDAGTKKKARDTDILVPPARERATLIHDIIAFVVAEDYPQEVDWRLPQTVSTLAWLHVVDILPEQQGFMLKQATRTDYLLFVSPGGLLYKRKSGDKSFTSEPLYFRIRLITSSRRHIVVLTETGQLLAAGRRNIHAMGLGEKGYDLAMGELQFYLMEMPPELQEADVLQLSCSDETTLVLTTAGLFACGELKVVSEIGKSLHYSDTLRLVYPSRHIVAVTQGPNHVLLLFSNGLVRGNGEQTSNGELGASSWEHWAAVNVEEGERFFASDIGHNDGTVPETLLCQKDSDQLWISRPYLRFIKSTDDNYDAQKATTTYSGDSDMRLIVSPGNIVHLSQGPGLGDEDWLILLASKLDPAFFGRIITVRFIDATAFILTDYDLFSVTMQRIRFGPIPAPPLVRIKLPGADTDEEEGASPVKRIKWTTDHLFCEECRHGEAVLLHCATQLPFCSRHCYLSSPHCRSTVK